MKRNDDRTITMSPEELEDLLERVVKRTLTGIGIQVDDPLTMQRDFQHLRSLRETTESVKSKGLLTLMGILVSGALAVIILGVKTAFGRGGS